MIIFPKVRSTNKHDHQLIIMPEETSDRDSSSRRIDRSFILTLIYCTPVAKIDLDFLRSNVERWWFSPLDRSWCKLRRKYEWMRAAMHGWMTMGIGIGEWDERWRENENVIWYRFDRWIFQGSLSLGNAWCIHVGTLSSFKYYWH